MRRGVPTVFARIRPQHRDQRAPYIIFGAKHIDIVCHSKLCVWGGESFYFTDSMDSILFSINICWQRLAAQLWLASSLRLHKPRARAAYPPVRASRRTADLAELVISDNLDTPASAGLPVGCLSTEFQREWRETWKTEGEKQRKFLVWRTEH